MASIQLSSSLDLHAVSTWFGTVTTENPAQIQVVNGPLAVTYFGSFSYDIRGNVSGTLTGLTETFSGLPQITFTGLSVAAATAAQLINSNQIQQLLQIALAGNDQFTVTPGTHVIDGYGGSNSVTEPSAHSQYNITNNGTALVLTNTATNDTLYNIQTVNFSDGIYNVQTGVFTSTTGLLGNLNVNQQLELIYAAYFNRAADSAGFSFWQQQLTQAENQGQSAATALTNVANSFAPQSETEALYPSLDPYVGTSNPPPLNTAAGQGALNSFIVGVYGNLFGHAPNAAGQTYWVGQLTSGAVGLGAAALAIANGATGADAITVMNKIATAIAITPGASTTAVATSISGPSSQLAAAGNTSAGGTTTTFPYTILGQSDLPRGPVDVVQLRTGELFALQYVQNTLIPGLTTTSTIEFLNPTATSITNVTSLATSGAIPTNIGSTPVVKELYVGDNALPDIVLGDGGLDQPPWYGGQIRILAPNASGKYVDATSLLPQITAYNHRLSTGTIDGQAAIAIAMIGNLSNAPIGVELVIANADGTFTNWTSHLPSSVQNSIVYTYDAIGDFTGHGGDIFLGSENATVNSSVMLANNGSGGFTKMPVTIPVPQLFNTGEVDQNGYPASMVVVDALPTKFYGDTHEDLIVAYANSAATSYSGKNSTEAAYYLQFLQGNGDGGFTDVTKQHLPTQPELLTANGVNAWILQIQQVSINGLNDLVLYESGGSAEILINNGQDVYTPSLVQISRNMPTTAWGSDAGAQGFFGLTTTGQWTFSPVSAIHLPPNSAAITDPLASQVYLYGTDTTASSLAQTYITQVSITLHGAYASGVSDTFHVVVNGQEVGNASLAQIYGFTYQGSQYTSDQTFTFNLNGIEKISSLQVIVAPSSLPQLFLTNVAVNDVVLGNGLTNKWIRSPSNVATTTFDASAWNATIDPNVGTASDPIQVTGAGAGVTVFVLGKPTDYEFVTNASGTVTLTEHSGLNQNAVLASIANISFLDGATRNLSTGTWSVNTTSATVAANLSDYAPMVTSGMLTAVNVTDSAANVVANLDTLQTLAVAHELGDVTLTDSGMPTLTITKQQETADTLALAAIVTPHSIVIPLVDSLSIGQQLELIYIAYFNRSADGGGFTFWSEQNSTAQAGGQSASVALTNVANSFAPQAETIALYSILAPLASAGSIDLSTPTAQAGLTTFIGAVYQNLFNRAAESAGQSYWVSQITGGSVGLGAAALAIANGATGADAVELQNKIAVALDFTTRTNGAGLGTNAPLAASFMTTARGVLSGVDSTSLNDASVTAGMNATTVYITGAATGHQTAASLQPGDPDVITITGSGQLVDPGAGNHTIEFMTGVGADTLALHMGGVDLISGFDPSIDVLDLRTLLNEANVDLDGNTAVLGNFLAVVDQGADALVNFDPAGHSGGGTVAVLLGVGNAVTSLGGLVADGAVRIA
jgi:hypothetical protein